MSEKISTINGFMISSIIINTLVALSLLANPDYSDELIQTMTIVMGGFVLLSLIGMVLMSTNNYKLGSILAMIGFAIFVPIGLIGIIGVRKVSDARTRSEAGI